LDGRPDRANGPLGVTSEDERGHSQGLLAKDISYGSILAQGDLSQDLLQNAACLPLQGSYQEVQAERLDHAARTFSSPCVAQVSRLHTPWPFVFTGESPVEDAARVDRHVGATILPASDDMEPFFGTPDGNIQDLWDV